MKAILGKTILGNFVFINEENKSKKIKVRMFYNLQNLFWGVLSGGFLAWGFLSGGFCRGVYFREVFVREVLS